MDRNTLSVTLHGDALKKGNWHEWYDYIITLMSHIGYSATHAAMKSEEYTTAKVVTLSRKGEQISEMLKNGVCPTSFSIYSLSKDYKSASFDYDFLAVRTKNYISVTFNLCDSDKINVEDLVRQMKEYIEFDSGEIYEMERGEVPLLYAAQANSPDFFKTLKVVERL